MYALWRNTRRSMPALIWPLTYLIMAYGVVRATWLAQRRNGVYRRDTFSSLEELETGRRFTLERLGQQQLLESPARDDHADQTHDQQEGNMPDHRPFEVSQR